MSDIARPGIAGLTPIESAPAEDPRPASRAVLRRGDQPTLSGSYVAGDGTNVSFNAAAETVEAARELASILRAAAGLTSMQLTLTYREVIEL